MALKTSWIPQAQRAGAISGSKLVSSLTTCALLSACAGDGSEWEAQAGRHALMADAPIVVSQVYGGGGSTGAPLRNDFVELFNRSSSPIALGGYSLQYASATGVGALGSGGQIALFPGGASVAPGQYYLVQLAGGSAGASLPTPDASPSPTINLSAASGKVALVTGTSSLGCNGANLPCDASAIARIVDLVGYGAANFSETAPLSALNIGSAAARKGQGCTDTNGNNVDFDVGAPTPRNGVTTAVSCSAFDAAPQVSATIPSAGAIVPHESLSALQLTFSEPVSIAATSLSLVCSLSGTNELIASEPGTTFTLTLARPIGAGESCQLVVSASGVSDADSIDPPEHMASDFTLAFSTLGTNNLPIHAIQGVQHRSPLEGQTLSVGPAIVTVIRSNGFFMQDPEPDGNDATAEGIFVFTSSAPAVLVGDRVVVNGLIGEYRAGCASCTATNSAYFNLTTTQLTSPQITVLGHGQPLPAPTVLGFGSGERALPTQVFENDAQGDIELQGGFDPAQDGLDFLESLEGMRVSLDHPVVVHPTRSFSGGALEIGVLTRDGEFASPRTSRGGIVITPNDFNPERLFLSNALIPSFPLLNVGDRLDGQVVGVVDYSFANYKILVTQALPPAISGELDREVTELTATTSTQLTMANLNVENLDANDPTAKFDRLAAIIVTNLGSPDLLALEEVQDNDGATNNATVDASQTLNRLVTAISAAQGPLYAYRQINPQDDQDGGEPGGNIRVALFYRTDRGLSFVDRPGASATTDTSISNVSGAPHLTFSPGRIAPTNAAFSNSRKPLAAELTFGGTTFFVIANHFNSKGGDEPLSGRFQPPERASEAQRNAQASLVAGFVQGLLLADPAAAVVVLGDLNDFYFSPPLSTLKATGLVAMIETLPQSERYTYVYQGNSQDLDHILLSPSLASRAAFDVVHVNAEFADQASDHDPSVVKIELGSPAVIITTAPTTPVAVGSSFSVQLEASGSPAPSFVLEQGPAGMQVSATGLVTWQAQAPGTTQVRIRAENGVGEPAVISFNLTVVAPGVAVPASSLSTTALGALLMLAVGRTARSRRRRVVVDKA